MVFRAKAGYSYKIRVYDERGRSAVLGTGTPDEATAKAMGAMLKGFRRRYQWDVLNALVARKVSLPKVYAAFESNRLPEFMAELSSPDLDQLAEEWSKNANAKYVKQLRRYILRGDRFPASEFTRSSISRFIASLHASGSTKNRYRAALSVFAGWLVEREVLDHNPVRSVKPSKPNPARELYHERADAVAVVGQLPAPFNAIEALMANGLERQVIERLVRKDIKLDRLTIDAHGSKTPHRNRVVRITEPWTVPYIQKHIATMTPNAQVCTVKLDRVLDTHKRTCRALKIQVTTLHDWRHTYAVNSLRDGMKPETVARQLGHRDASLVHKVYGRFIVDERDYLTSKVTTTVTKREKRRAAR